MMRVEIFVAILLLIVGPANAQTTTFTYQGYLTEAGTAADGAFDFELASATSTRAAAPSTSTRSTT